MNEAQVESAINEAVAKMFEGNDIDKKFLDKIVRSGIYEIMFGILTLHNLPKKAFVDCTSEEDADMLITICTYQQISISESAEQIGTLH